MFVLSWLCMVIVCYNPFVLKYTHVFNFDLYMPNSFLSTEKGTFFLFLKRIHLFSYVCT